MHIKQLSTLEQIKTLQELRNKYALIDREINAIRKEYNDDDSSCSPALDTIIHRLKLQFAEEKIAESTAMASRS